MVENQRKEKKRGRKGEEKWSSFSGLTQRLPACRLPASAADHGGSSGVWRFLSQRSRGWRRRPPYWKRRSTPALFHLALDALLPRPGPGLERARPPLAGLRAQLLPVGGRLLRLGLGAGVGAAVEGRHRRTFGVGVLPAVRRLVAGLVLRGALHLLQGADWKAREQTSGKWAKEDESVTRVLLVRSTLLLQQRVLPLQVVDVLLVRVVFPPHILDVLCGFV